MEAPVEDDDDAASLPALDDGGGGGDEDVEDNDVHVDDEPQEHHGGNASLSDFHAHVICSFFVQFSSLTAGTVSLFFYSRFEHTT